MAQIKFLTDSASDIPPALREQLSIQVLPFPIAMGERELRDGFDFTPQEFYEMLLAAPKIPTHSQLTGFVFEECFERALEEGYSDLIYTAINSKGSSTCQNAVQAREDFYRHHPQAREKLEIRIIDAKTYTMGYGWAVVQGAQMAAQGADAGEIAAYIQDWVDHVRVVFAPLDLRFAKKSGRVSAAAAFVGEALGLKPVMTFVDGESRILSKVRGEKNVIPALVKLCREGRAEGSPYLLIRGNNAPQSDKLAQTCRQELGEEPALEYSIGGVIAINAGPNLVGLIYRER